MTEPYDNNLLSADISASQEAKIGRDLGFSSSKVGSEGHDSKIVTARGTEDGLVLRIDGKAHWPEILSDVEAFLGERRKFFEGGEVSIEWLDRLPTMEQSKELEDLLRNGYGMGVIVKRKKSFAVARDLTANEGVKEQVRLKGSSVEGSRKVRNLEQGREHGAIHLYEESTPVELQQEDIIQKQDNMNELSSFQRTKSGSILSSELMLAKGLESEFGDIVGKKYASRMAKMLGDDLFYEDDANAKVIFGTLRSGQRVETPFSLIIIGDVNPGADLVAGGDIVVFGSLRGTAHASAYDDEAFDRVIIALQMQPMQLRIGSVISRGSDEVVKGAEIARIDSRRIVVEAFNPKSTIPRRKAY